METLAGFPSSLPLQRKNHRFPQKREIVSKLGAPRRTDNCGKGTPQTSTAGVPTVGSYRKASAMAVRVCGKTPPPDYGDFILPPAAMRKTQLLSGTAGTSPATINRKYEPKRLDKKNAALRTRRTAARDACVDLCGRRPHLRMGVRRKKASSEQGRREPCPCGGVRDEVRGWRQLRPCTLRPLRPRLQDSHVPPHQPHQDKKEKGISRKRGAAAAYSPRVRDC